MIKIVSRSNNFLTDKRLRFNDKGFMALLMMVVNKDYSKSELATVSKDNDIDEVEVIVNRLVRLGYLEVFPSKDNNLWNSKEIKWSFKVDGSGQLGG